MHKAGSLIFIVVTDYTNCKQDLGFFLKFSTGRDFSNEHSGNFNLWHDYIRIYKKKINIGYRWDVKNNNFFSKQYLPFGSQKLPSFTPNLGCIHNLPLKHNIQTNI